MTYLPPGDHDPYAPQPPQPQPPQPPQDPYSNPYSQPTTPYEQPNPYAQPTAPIPAPMPSSAPPTSPYGGYAVVAMPPQNTMALTSMIL